MKWKPYQKYRDSGIKWVGQIPSHWAAGTVKQRYEIQLGKMLQNYPETPQDKLVLYMKAAHVMWGKVDT